jgi:amino acid transporter
MIQRVQSLYYLVCMVLLGSCLIGLDILRFVGQDKSYYSFNVYGFKYFANNDSFAYQSGYYFIILIVLILLTFYTLMNYKNLAKQLKLSRNISFLYLAMVIALVVYSAIGGDYFFEGDNVRELGPGFMLLVISFPFSYLAQLGIKRDKKLLDSLNRLR